VYVLDPATLQRLQCLEFPREISVSSEALVFSPDSRVLTSVRNNDQGTGWFVVSWDLQTGGVVSTIERKEPHDTEVGDVRITYSMNGQMVAILSRYESSTIISIHDVVSGAHPPDVYQSTHTNPDLDLGSAYVYKIWTHGELLRYATPGPTGITIWEVGFTPGVTPMEVETVSIPDNTIETFVFTPRQQDDILWTEFHPASCRLAFIGTRGTLLVWDARASKFLLHHTGVSFLSSMTFSSDGHFFASTTIESQVFLWRESHAGYTLLTKFTTPCSKLHFSPNGELIITSCGSKVQLWHMKSFTTTSSSLTQEPKHTSEDFILEFLPDRSLAVIAQKKDKTVIVLDLKSSIPLLAIDTSIEVYGLRPIQNTIVVIGDEKAIMWNLPECNLLPDARMSIRDSIQSIKFRDVDNSIVFAASISLNFQYISLARYGAGAGFLDIYCTSTGQNICEEVEVIAFWFTPSRHDIWCAAAQEAKVFTVTQGTLNHTKTIADIEDESWGCPWGSSHGYRVTQDGWILGMGGKRLLALPPLWQSQFKVYRVWNGKFLALLHGGLPELVILELEP
jgi:WD40 repeat protein